MLVRERFKNYSKDHCWQYEIRLQNLEDDLKAIGLSKDEMEKLSIGDFCFSYVGKEDKKQCEEIKHFIKKHEWLGNIPNRPTHRFTARLKQNSALAGVVIMAIPNTFGNLLGKDKDKNNLEKLVARGASISWAPKNLGSWLVSKSVKWMVQNTDFRIFTAYSDPEAKELGTIYQAMNWIYLGQTSGTAKQYLDPAKPDKGWFSSRDFRKRSKYNMYIKRCGIDKKMWESWMKKWSPNWELVPPIAKEMVKQEEKKYRSSCISRTVPPKHKYCYILGRSKKETKQLKKLFVENNPNKINLPYPKKRGE
mgnify:CR=1 FL=1